VTGFASPDIPAYWSYAVVLVVALVVARGNVNNLVARFNNRWAFAGTWWLFLAYLTLPIVLFWFLDYTSALQDTSLFAALAVAAGYRQVFAGGIQGISMPGQTSALWQPFEAWVFRTNDVIQTRQKQYKDRFDERVRASFAADPGRLGQFETLVFERSNDPAALTAALAPLRTTPPPPGAPAKIVNVLWRDLRTSEAENYGYLLYRRGLVSWWQYWRWLEDGRSKLITAGICLACVALIIVVALWMTGSVTEGEPWRRPLLTYHQWRFLKVNASDRDRWRSREYLTAELRSVSPDAPRAAEQTAAILGRLIRELRFREVSARQADDVLQLVVDAHSPVVTASHMPELIECLRTQNDTVRLRIHRALLALHQAEYAATKPDTKLAEWVPAKDESPGDVDARVRLWQQWWEGAKRAAASARTPLAR
jgi:hypothetical protein